jgi:hypothetical protein
MPEAAGIRRPSRGLVSARLLSLISGSGRPASALSAGRDVVPLNRCNAYQRGVQKTEALFLEHDARPPAPTGMAQFSGAVKIADLNDFIAPSQSCVVSLKGNKLQIGNDEKVCFPHMHGAAALVPVCVRRTQSARCRYRKHQLLQEGFHKQKHPVKAVL